MIGAEMPRCARTLDGRVEHAADIGGRDGSPVHADTDEATRELVHDHQHPVAPEPDGFAPKEVHAPEAVCRVANERQPRGPGSARGGAIVVRQHAVHDVLVDVDSERLRDDPRNPWTAEPGIARLQFDDGLDEGPRPAPSGRASSGTVSMRTAGGTCTAPRPDETRAASKGVRRWRPSEASGTEEERPDSAEQSVAQRQIGARRRARRRTISCCLSTRFSAITARTPPGPHSFAVTTAR